MEWVARKQYATAFHKNKREHKQRNSLHKGKRSAEIHEKEDQEKYADSPCFLPLDINICERHGVLGQAPVSFFCSKVLCFLKGKKGSDDRVRKDIHFRCQICDEVIVELP